MARTVLLFTAKSWLTFFSWTFLVFATMAGIGLICVARDLPEWTATFPGTTMNDTAALVVEAESQHDLMVLASSMLETGLVRILIITLLGTTLIIGNKTNSLRTLLLFILESLMLMMFALVLMIKKIIETGKPPVKTKEGLVYLGYLAIYYFILHVVNIRLSEIRDSIIKIKTDDCEKKLVVSEKKDATKSYYVDCPATVVMNVKC